MRVLILGGTGEAKRLAKALHEHGYATTYCVADPEASAEVPCAIRRGGFGGAGGLSHELIQGGYTLLVDATHPYAANISHNARMAASRAGVALWAVRRPPWEPEPGAVWTTLSAGATAWEAAAGLRRPLFTIGPSPLDETPVPAGQHWFVRCLPGHRREQPANATILAQRGPFGIDDEKALFALMGIDGLVTKNSGGDAVAAKLGATRDLGIEVRMLPRPELPRADCAFDTPEALLEALPA